MTRISAARARRLAPGAVPYASDLEAAFFAALALHGADLPAPCRELVFAPPRRWRFDAAWPAAMLAAECDGGQWAAGGGRHNTDADREKLNAAAALGWRVLRFSASMITDNPVGCVDAVRRALGRTP